VPTNIAGDSATTWPGGYSIRDISAVQGAIDLFRIAYERATAKRGKDE
jgi:hypothetical protein